MPLDLDIGLRPEGKNGAIVRSLDSYRAYYGRWSLTWEAQALLRAAGRRRRRRAARRLRGARRRGAVPGDRRPQRLREIKRIKARVENERLPQGADPARHLKLGRGSLSDVEWLVQLLQLSTGTACPGLRTTSTLGALRRRGSRGSGDCERDAGRLREAWLLASRARSAITLWTAKTSDVLPTDRKQLEGVARLLGVPAGLGDAARGGLPAHHPAGAAGVRAALLRREEAADDLGPLNYTEAVTRRRSTARTRTGADAARTG